MASLLSELAGRNLKDRFLSVFGSFTWAGQTVKKILAYNEEKLKLEIVGNTVEIKQSLSEETRQQCEQLGKEIAKKLAE